MTPIILIAGQTMKELIRDRILWTFFAAAIGLVILSLLLGSLTFIEHVKITIDLGLAMIHILGLALSVFLGTTLVGKEIRNRTVYAVLARPLSRQEYILGKFFGLMGIVGLSCIFLSVALLILLKLLDHMPTQSFFVSLWGILWEMGVVSSFALLLSLITSPMVGAFATVGWWAAGTLSTDIYYFAQKSQGAAVEWIGNICYYLVPRLDLFAIKNRVVYEATIPGSEVLQFSFYGTCLVGLLLALSMWIFSKKEL